MGHFSIAKSDGKIAIFGDSVTFGDLFSSYELKTIMSRLKRPEICGPETYQELIRTPNM